MAPRIENSLSIRMKRNVCLDVPSLCSYFSHESRNLGFARYEGTRVNFPEIGLIKNPVERERNTLTSKSIPRHQPHSNERENSYSHPHRSICCWHILIWKNKVRFNLEAILHVYLVFLQNRCFNLENSYPSGLAFGTMLKSIALSASAYLGFCVN